MNNNQLRLPSNRPDRNLLVFPNALADPVEAVCHEQAGCEEVNGRPEAASRQISFVLDWLVAARGRHILWHGG